MEYQQETPARTREGRETDGSIDDTQSPKGVPLHPVLRLQQSIGNRTLQRLLGNREFTLQRKLAVSAADDPYEHEAERVANEVVSMPAPAPNLFGHDSATRQTPKADDRVQMKALASTITPLVQCTTEREVTGRDAPSGQPRSDLQGRFAPAADFEARLNSGDGGSALPTGVRAFMEPRFGADFSGVRLHTDNESAQLNEAVGAEAFTHGRDIYLGGDNNDLESSAGQQLLAHELTHVVQQSGIDGIPPGPSNQQPGLLPNTLQRQPVKDAGVDDEPLPGGIREPRSPRSPSDMSDSELGPALAKAREAGDTERVEAIEAEMEKRGQGWGTAAPAGPGPVTTGVGAVTPEVALQILENMSGGQPPFKPELGLGGCSWFTTEGNPYTATSPAKSIQAQVEINKGSDPLVFKESDLVKIYNAEAGPAAVEAEAQYRSKFNIDAAAKLSNRAQKAINRVLRGFTEKRMWTRVGEKVAASSSKVGEVVLEAGGDFSAAAGKFAVVADATKVTLKGGTGPIVDALGKAGVTAEPVVVEAAESLARSLKWAGRVRGVFRYGGRVLIVVGVTMDLIKIYRAKDKWKATITSVAGWAGATAAGAAFAAWWTPADVAGPWAWAGHGVGTLVAGGIGYWVGSEATRYIYELAVEP
jgi:hypothetical protein